MLASIPPYCWHGYSEESSFARLLPQISQHFTSLLPLLEGLAVGIKKFRAAALNWSWVSS